MSDGYSKIWNSKRDCRSYFKSLWAEKQPQELVQYQIRLDAHLLNFMSRQLGVWAGYRALPAEASVDKALGVPNIDWAFPKVLGSSKALEFFRAQGFVVGAYGILEPDELSTFGGSLDLGQMQGLLIPGLAFSRRGDRLGKGQGFYDRVLENFVGLKVGVCFDFQISEQTLPVEDHDVRMDFIITDAGITECQQVGE